MAISTRPLPLMVNEIVENIGSIFRGEIRLAVTEVKEEAAKTARAAALLGIGLVLALYAPGLLMLTGIYALSTALSPWLAALIITVAVAATSTLLILVGMKRLKSVQVKPDKTIASMKENVEWAKRQVR